MSRRSSACIRSPSRMLVRRINARSSSNMASSLFVVARTAQLIEGRIAFGETHLFVGRGYVVSIRHGASTTYSTVRERCEASPIMLAHGEDYILYAVLDFIVDNYMPVLETVNAEVETIEDHVLDATLTQADVQRLYLLRRDLLRLRNAAAPLVDVCRRLEHAKVMAIDPDAAALSRRHRPRASGSRSDRRNARDVGIRFRGEPHDRAVATDRDYTAASGMGGDPRRADGRCWNLRHELRAHARIEMGVRLLSCGRPDRRHMYWPLFAIP